MSEFMVHLVSVLGIAVACGVWVLAQRDSKIGNQCGGVGCNRVVGGTCSRPADQRCDARADDT